ncbi:MAG: alpha/beta hydrolase [Pirellulales bacterium]
MDELSTAASSSPGWRYRKRWPLACAAALIALLVAALAVCWRMASAAVAPAHFAVGAPPHDLPAETIQLASRSGATIAAWHVPVENSRGVVVLLHPIRGSRLTMVDRARLFRSAGYSVVMIDFRGHGESTGDSITLGHLEQHDARAAVEFARSRHPGEPIVVVGWSLGGAAALLASPLGIDALILEEVYPTITEALENRTRMRVGPLAPLATAILVSQLEPRLGVAAEELRPIDEVAAAGCPILLLAGADDQHTTLEQSKRMFAAAAEPKQYVYFEGAAHVDLLRYDNERYRRATLNFLDAQLRQRAVADGVAAPDDELAPLSGASRPVDNSASSTAASASR